MVKKKINSLFNGKTSQIINPRLTSIISKDEIHYPTFDGSVQYKSLRSFTVPTNPGVYFIHDFRGIIYIGEAKNLRQRFLQHHNGEENIKLAELARYPFGDLRFYWINTDTKLKAVKIQKLWIRIFQPISNNIKYNKDRS